MEGIDRSGRFGAKADMDAAFWRDPRHARAQIDPELRIALAEADRARPRHQPRKPERGQDCLIEPRGSFEVADADGDMVDHNRTPNFLRHCERSEAIQKSIHGESLDCFVALLLAMTATVSR